MLLGNKVDVDEAECVQLINNGDKAAYEQLFEKYYRKLYRFAFQYVHSGANAENIVQEVFLNIWEQREQLDSTKNIGSFLYQSVRNKALDYIKHENIVKEKLTLLKVSHEDSLTNSTSIEKKKILASVQDQIESLPSKTRRIYKLSRAEGLTYKEIADVEEISTKTVEYHITKANKVLRQKLQDQYPNAS